MGLQRAVLGVDVIAPTLKNEEKSAMNGFVLANAAINSPGRDRPGMVDDAIRLVFLALPFFIGLKARFEGIDALAEVTHDPRQLSAAAEQDDDDRQDDQKMPNA
jgi:hypothetical protein